MHCCPALRRGGMSIVLNAQSELLCFERLCANVRFSHYVPAWPIIHYIGSNSSAQRANNRLPAFHKSYKNYIDQLLGRDSREAFTCLLHLTSPKPHLSSTEGPHLLGWVLFPNNSPQQLAQYPYDKDGKEAKLSAKNKLCRFLFH